MHPGVWDTDGVNPRSTSATFAGREHELDRLASMLAQLDDTGARTVLIAGEAGIGKSRLADELAEHAHAAGALVGVGVCTPAEGGGLAYGPVVGVLRDLARQTDEHTVGSVLGAARRGLGIGAPESVPVDGDAAPPVELAKTRVFEALLEACTSLAERSRVVLVFEDLHWADSASIEVVEFLARNLAGSPVLLIGTYRSDELLRDHALARLVAELTRVIATSTSSSSRASPATRRVCSCAASSANRLIGRCSTPCTLAAAGTRSSRRS